MTHGYVYEFLRKIGLSTFGATTGEFLLVKPMRILAIVLVAWIVGRITTKAIRRTVRGAQSRTPLKRASARAEQRAATVGDVLASQCRAAVWSVAGLLILDEVGFDLAPLLAGAGIAGIAVGFGAQSLVKDFLSGLFILLEDQYGVGDTVSLADTTGTVEEVTLRTTRVRSLDGTVWFIPNGELRKVGNSSMEWSRALIDVLVGYDTDLKQVTALIEEQAADMAADPAWADDVLEPPEVWGVHAIGSDGVTVRVVAKTAPRRQAAVSRELRGRIASTLRAAGVKMPGGPTIMLQPPATAS
jgi:small conductance mechanosensitive channel